MDLQTSFSGHCSGKEGLGRGCLSLYAASGQAQSWRSSSVLVGGDRSSSSLLGLHGVPPGRERREALPWLPTWTPVISQGWRRGPWSHYCGVAPWLPLTLHWWWQWGDWEMSPQSGQGGSPYSSSRGSMCWLQHLDCPDPAVACICCVRTVYASPKKLSI